MGSSSGRAPPRLGGGRFQVVDQIGDGGTATVYLAWDGQERGWCALKALQLRHLGDDDVRRRFDQEAEALRTLQHPNIPRLIAHDPDAVPPYMAMELARCGSTMDWVREHGPMPPALAADVIFQVCEALGAVHAAGMVHRDVKPHNVLIDDLGVCKLTDFGIARIDDDSTRLTQTGSQIGTFSFMAPEQRTDTKSVDHRADIYSVGALLFTLLTGRMSGELFVAATDESMLRDVPEAFRDAFLRATRYRPEERFPTIRALQAELMGALSRMSPSTADAPPLVRPQQPLPVGPPATVTRRFPDLERALGPSGAAPSADRGDGDPAPPRKVIPYFMPARVEPERRRPEYVDASEVTTSPALPPTAGEPRPPVSPAPVVGWLAAGMGCTTLPIGLGFATVVIGAVLVGSAQREALEAAEALTDALQVDGNVVYELPGDQAPFEAIYQRYADAPDAEAQLDAALAFVAALEASVAEGSEVTATTPKVRRLRDARDAYLRRQSAWAAQASRFPGGLAVRVGLVRGPVAPGD